MVEVTDQAASSRRTYTSASSSRSSKSSRSGSSRSKRKAKSKAATKTTTVRQGDTLSQIAARNGTTVKKLRQLNGIKGNLINVGQKIRVK